ncbi:YbjO family protein [Dickeya oryzae]
MLTASLVEFLPPIFHVSGDGVGEILHHLLMQRLPDFLLILLLFLPRRSQRFFYSPSLTFPRGGDTIGPL